VGGEVVVWLAYLAVKALAEVVLSVAWVLGGAFRILKRAVRWMVRSIGRRFGIAQDEAVAPNVSAPNQRAEPYSFHAEIQETGGRPFVALPPDVGHEVGQGYSLFLTGTLSGVPYRARLGSSSGRLFLNFERQTLEATGKRSGDLVLVTVNSRVS
jgi:hypothetical protein